MKKKFAIKIIKDLIKEFNNEIKDKVKEKASAKQYEDWSHVMHLVSVIECLDYVTDRMKILCREIKLLEE